MQHARPSLTLVGAGHYGCDLVGPKVLRGEIPATLAALVDTDPKKDASFLNQHTKLGLLANIQDTSARTTLNPARWHVYMNALKEAWKNKRSNNPPKHPDPQKIFLFKTLDSWDQALGKIRRKNREKLVVDLALPTEATPVVFKTLVQKGIQQMILPKPLTFDWPAFQQMKQLARAHHVKAAIASNWYYSELPQRLKDVLKALVFQGPWRIQKVEAVFSKLPQLNQNFDPQPITHLEIPHVLQILNDTGILPAGSASPRITHASDTSIRVQYQPSHVPQGIVIESDVDKNTSSPTGRERFINFYLNDADPEPDILADFDVAIDPATGTVTKYGSITVQIDNEGKHIHHQEHIAEDNLRHMYQKILNALPQPWQHFMQDRSVMTLDRYEPLLRDVINIHTAWLEKMGRQPIGILRSFPGTHNAHQQQDA